MRPLRLASVALEAEALRLRYHLRRVIARVIFAILTLVLGCGTLLFLHIAAWYWLRQSLPPHQVGLIFAAIDLTLTAVLAFLAARSRPGKLEREAAEVRRRALSEATDSLILVRLVRLLLKR